MVRWSAAEISLLQTYEVNGFLKNVLSEKNYTRLGMFKNSSGVQNRSLGTNNKKCCSWKATILRQILNWQTVDPVDCRATIWQSLTGMALEYRLTGESLQRGAAAASPSGSHGESRQSSHVESWRRKQFLWLRVLVGSGGCGESRRSSHGKSLPLLFRVDSGIDWRFYNERSWGIGVDGLAHEIPSRRLGHWNWLGRAQVGAFEGDVRTAQNMEGSGWAIRVGGFKRWICTQKTRRTPKNKWLGDWNRTIRTGRAQRGKVAARRIGVTLWCVDH